MKRKIELVDGKVVFSMETDTLLRTETVAKEQAIDLYKQSLTEKENIMKTIESHEKKISDMDIKHDEELEKFIEMANKANKYSEFKQLSEQRDNLLTNLNNLNLQIEDLENVLPELKK